ncbi:MAG: ABC transporter ATP-binding protein [Thermorudis peleae]|nr:ABC transporter ATP-binding protein [Thermorudis peleae]
MEQQRPIQTELLTRFYGARRGVEDLTFTLEPGEIFGFLGPNGAGKTTTIRLLMGLLRPTRGKARIFGYDCWREAAAVKRYVGYVPGDIRLYDHLTGWQHIDLFAGLRGGVDRGRVRQLLDRFDYDPGPRVRTLSTGNRQKLALILALMHDPPLLVLDEPTSGLDPVMQHVFVEVLREEQARGKTVFLSSHRLSEVDQLADRVGIIRDGRLLLVEPITTVRQRYARRMEVWLNAPVTEAAFADLPGVQIIAIHDGGRHVELTNRGDVRALLGRLSQLPVRDFTYAPPDLESVFLAIYRDAEAAHPTEVQA